MFTLKSPATFLARAVETRILTTREARLSERKAPDVGGRGRGCEGGELNTPLSEFDDSEI